MFHRVARIDVCLACAVVQHGKGGEMARGRRAVAATSTAVAISAAGDVKAH